MQDIATLALATYILVQLIKPALTAKFLPQTADWQNMAMRALVFAIAYLFTFINTLASGVVVNGPWLWAMLPKAGIVFAAAVATYHLGDWGDTTAAAAPVTVLGQIATIRTSDGRVLAVNLKTGAVTHVAGTGTGPQPEPGSVSMLEDALAAPSPIVLPTSASSTSTTTTTTTA